MNIDAEVAALAEQTLLELRARYAELYGDVPRTNSKPWLIKRIAWRWQALAEGDLSERARRRAAELANDADLRLNPPRPRTNVKPTASAAAVASDSRLPPAGSVLMRSYKGTNVEVTVRADGFEYDGRVYRSLSAVAKAITSGHCNGFWFFREALGKRGGER